MPGLYQQTGKYVAIYRAAVCIGYYWLLPDISCKVLKFMNFQVTKMYGNNGTFYGDTKI